jgi:hypothetical protein
MSTPPFVPVTIAIVPTDTPGMLGIIFVDKDSATQSLTVSFTTGMDLGIKLTKGCWDEIVDATKKLVAKQ